MNQNWRFVAGLFLSSLLLAVEHWAPWPQVLKRWQAYTIGVGTLLLGMFIWQGATLTMLGITMFAVCGGFAVLVAYALDHYLNLKQRVNHYERHE